MLRLDEQFLKERALELGFSLCRITTALPISHDELKTWLAEDKHGNMRYMARSPERRCDPSSLLPNAKSVLCCALAYDEGGLKSSCLNKTTSHERARFARGADYHDVVREKLDKLSRVIKESSPNASIKCCVDTSPLLEKALAQRAGLGWIGKNCLLINPSLGSWFVLGEIITDLELKPDASMEGQCGSCDECIQRCPTNALDGKSLDARRCISYLTIEHKGNIDPHFKQYINDKSYGCDICQEACPYNSSEKR